MEPFYRSTHTFPAYQLPQGFQYPAGEQGRLQEALFDAYSTLSNTSSEYYAAANTVEHNQDSSPFRRAKERWKTVLGEDRERVVELILKVFIAGEQPLLPETTVDLYVSAVLSLPGCLDDAIRRGGGFEAIAAAADAAAAAREIEAAAEAQRLAAEAQATANRLDQEAAAATAAAEAAQIAALAARARADEEAAKDFKLPPSAAPKKRRALKASALRQEQLQTVARAAAARRARATAATSSSAESGAASSSADPGAASSSADPGAAASSPPRRRLRRQSY